jgi:hypothetical protein
LTSRETLSFNRLPTLNHHYITPPSCGYAADRSVETPAPQSCRLGFARLPRGTSLSWLSQQTRAARASTRPRQPGRSRHRPAVGAANRPFAAITPEVGGCGALGSGALKRPKRAMVDAWSGLDNRPVRPASRTATQEPSAPAGAHRRHRGNSRSIGPGTAAESGNGRDAPWQPNPAARPQPTIRAICGRPRWPTCCTCRPRPCPAWAKEGKLPFLKTLGGHRRYPEAEIRELAEELREEAMT